MKIIFKNLLIKYYLRTLTTQLVRKVTQTTHQSVCTRDKTRIDFEN